MKSKQSITDRDIPLVASTLPPHLQASTAEMRAIIAVKTVLYFMLAMGAAGKFDWVNFSKIVLTAESYRELCRSCLMMCFLLFLRHPSTLYIVFHEPDLRMISRELLQASWINVPIQYPNLHHISSLPSCLMGVRFTSC